ETFGLPFTGSPTVISLDPSRLDYFVILWNDSSQTTRVLHGVETLYTGQVDWYDWTPAGGRVPRGRPPSHASLRANIVWASNVWQPDHYYEVFGEMISTPRVWWYPVALSAYWATPFGLLARTDGNTTSFGTSVDGTIGGCPPFVPLHTLWTPGSPMY